jgi:ribonuclease/clavin/mitogillin
VSGVGAEPTAVEWLRDDLVRVPLRTPTLPPATRTNAYVLRTAAGWWAIDPGAPEAAELAPLLGVIDEIERRGEAFGGWIVTHHHPDHWAGLSLALAARPAPVVLHEASAVRAADGAGAWDVWEPARFDALALGARLLHTPGHSRDHLVAWLPGGDVVAGDLVAGIGTVVISPPDGHLGAYLRSLRALQRGLDGEAPRRLFPAHGPTIEEGALLLGEYIAHREARERQVLDALAVVASASDGVVWASPEQLVPLIYAEVPTYLHPVAARSVLAHLEKLEEEGRVQRERGLWRLS